MTTFKSLASMLAKAEGRKHEASIGDVREILSLLIQLCRKDRSVLEFMFERLRIADKILSKRENRF